jgi:hypothetical protein
MSLPFFGRLLKWMVERRTRLHRKQMAQLETTQ